MQPIVQLNILLPNTPGNLAIVSDKLRAANVNIAAISCTEGTSNTMLHLIVDDTETAKLVLQPSYKVTAAEALAFLVKNKPGTIASIARACAGAKLNIRTIYSTSSGKEAMLYVWLDDMARAREVFHNWHDPGAKLIA